MSSELEGLTNRWWHWRVERKMNESLMLIADDALTHHYAVEVEFCRVVYMQLRVQFSHPTFREPTEHEVERVRAALDGDTDGVTIFAWDTDGSDAERTFLVAAASVAVREGAVTHE